MQHWSFSHWILGAFALAALTACGGPRNAGATSPTGAGLARPDVPTAESDPSLQGGNSSGGGDAYASDFKKIGREFVAVANWRNVKQLEGVLIDDLRRLIEGTQIQTVDFALYHSTQGGQSNGHPICASKSLSEKDSVPADGPANHRVDAINCPIQHKILLSLIHWKNNLSLYQKRRLVLHEYLGLLNKPDSNYETSQRFLKQLTLSSTFRDNNFYGPVAQAWIRSLKWKASEKTEIQTAHDGRDGAPAFSLIGTQFKLVDKTGKTVLYCEEGTGIIHIEGDRVPLNPPAQCWIDAQSVEIGTIATIKVQVTEEQFHLLRQRLQAPPSAKATSLDSQVGPLTFEKLEKGGVITCDLSD